MKLFRIASALVFTGFFSSLFSQNTIGFKGGYTHAWPEYGAIELPGNAETHINGYNFSIFYFYELRKNFAIGIAPGYVKRGAACFPGWQPVFVGDSKVYLNYFEFPVLLQKSFDVSNSAFKLNSSVGYGVSKLMSAYLHTEQFGSSEPPIVTQIKVDNNEAGTFDMFDHGLYATIGFSYVFKNQHSIFFESSYYYGLKDYDKLNTSKNRSLNVNIGYSFPI